MSGTVGPRLSTVFQNQYSFQFDGTNEYVNIPDNNNLSFGNGITDSPFSISAWVNMTDATRFRLVSKIDSTNLEYLFSTSATDKIVFNCYDDSTNARIGRLYNTALTSFEGQWIHLVATYDGSSSSNGLKIYLNGTRVDEADNNNGTYIAMENTAAVFEIGRYTSTYANGNIDEVAVFNYELSAANVTTIYNDSTPVDLLSLSPISWWRMGDGDTYYDMVNGFLNSENINGWVRTNLNTTGTPPYLNVEVAPDGQTTADKMIEDTSTNTHYIRHTANIVTGVEYNVSCYLKAAERTKVRIRTNIDGNGLSTCNLDLTTGVVSNSTFPNDIVVTDEGNGWWRFSTYTTSVFTASNSVIYVFLYDALDQLTYTGDGTSGVYVWGLQLSSTQEVLPYFATAGSIRYVNSWLILDNGNENNLGATVNMEEADRVIDTP